MSSETTNNSNMLSGLGTSLAFSAVLSGGFGSLSTLKTYGKGSIDAVKANNAVLKEFAENATGDVFTRNLKTATNYQEYSRLAKQAAKLEKKLKKGKVAKLEAENARTIANTAATTLEDGNSIGKFTANIKKITDKGETVEVQTIKTAAGALDKADDILSSSKALLKSEFKDPMNFIGAGIEIFTRVQSEVIPAFQNEGFGAGIKSLGKALTAGATSFVADAGFSVAFRTIGATIGGILGPAGSAVGMMVGNAVGAFFSNKVVQKIFPMKEDNAVEIAQSTEKSSNSQTSQATQNTTTNPIPKVTKNGYITPQNGVYATDWVNESLKNGTIVQPYKQQLDMKA